MKFPWIVIAVTALVAGFGVLAADPALARTKHKVKPQCVDRPFNFSLSDWLWSARPHPQWNGCSPPVYVNGEFIGQDSDPNIRASLRRVPGEGYRIQH